MRASRQSSLPRPPGPASGRRPRGAGFTLIELIFVLALLAIAAAFVASNLHGFFHARTLSFEARRMLSLAQYGQSRAAAEGVPVVLWVDAKNATYGLTTLSSFNDPDGDPHANAYALESSLSLETPIADNMIVSEQDDEKLGLPDDLVAIRFNPDGLIDESSVHKITLRQGTEGALDLVPAANGLSYEIRPASDLN